MNHGEAWSSGGRRGSRGRSQPSGQWVIRQKSETPVTVDKSLDESSGNRGRGSRGRGGSRTSCSPRNSYGRGNDEQSPVQVYVNKSNVGFVEKGVQQNRKSQDYLIGSTKQPDDGAAGLNSSGDNKAVLQSKSTNVSGGLFVSGECEAKGVKEGAKMHCDVLNRMKDVTLSCQESVSPTSDKKVELSIVEDHKSAPKADRAGNSSKESSSSPFDIFLQKAVMGLKPSILELSREKRKAAKGYTGSVIRPGMVLLKNYLSINDQVMIVNKCLQLGLGEGGFYQPGYRDEAKLHLKMMCLGKNWDPETCRYGEIRPIDGSTPPKIPAEFNQFVEKAVKESQSLAASNSKETKGVDGIPFMLPDICIVNFYTSTGRLGLHQDKDESENSIRKGLPVVSFSIGDSAEFLYGDQRDEDKAETLILESGDVLLFGGKSRSVFHGVRSIRKDTAPKALSQETSLRPGRLNLTFRQY
ncbi:Alpha-ketoglutarate-dependent dioxygenase AlkB-like [Arabidopsis thaliana x Arabidopsis arenosa]|uniref:DNA N(6)-methyladenine demethylase n=1 Tax=Arabidopsis thaliana x Arabidopsis arenosa TaxID=1240361 RepID=A0A8T2ASV9_9BRAS|nr:Alpha-ketoglutarate-dependent dioxygenase AlkB-like [Arabidopsis thaliana x Arabidopsis arenosa]